MRNEKKVLFLLVAILLLVGISLVLINLWHAQNHIIPGLSVNNRIKLGLLGLVEALENYRKDTGVYPTTEQGLKALLSKPTEKPIPQNWKGPYLSREPTDRQGNWYQYKCPGIHNPQSYDVWSIGVRETKEYKWDVIIGNWE